MVLNSHLDSEKKNRFKTLLYNNGFLTYPDLQIAILIYKDDLAILGLSEDEIDKVIPMASAGPSILWATKTFLGIDILISKTIRDLLALTRLPGTCCLDKNISNFDKAKC